MLSVLLVLVFVLILILSRSRKTYDSYHIICAKYQKSTDFLDELDPPIRYSVLEKNKHVPNIAAEATTYLHYIIHNYDTLPKNLIFIHDENSSWHHEGKITDNVYGWIEEYEKLGKTYYEFNSHHTLSVDAVEEVQNLNRGSDNNKAYSDLWNTVFREYIGEFKNVRPKTGKCCAQFIVSRDAIRQHPREFYEKFYTWLTEKTSGEGIGSEDDIYSGYWTGRYAEYSWRFIFGR